MSPTEVARILPFSDDTIRRWDKCILEEKLGEVVLDDIDRILIDEKSIGKNHHYIILVLNGENGELLYMAKGKGYDSIKPFFGNMTKTQRENIDFACMDRNTSYPKAVMHPDYVTAEWRGKKVPWRHEVTKQKQKYVTTNLIYLIRGQTADKMASIGITAVIRTLDNHENEYRF